MMKPGAAKLENMIELDLQFNWEMSPVTSPEAGEGKFIGSGEGTVRGSRINGTVRWDLFEKQEEILCRSNLTGVIDTNDGATIQFDSRGFFLQPDQADPNKWITAAAAHFKTSDERYNWLNTCLAVWEGEFSMTTFHHHYHVYLDIAESPDSKKLLNTGS